MSEFPTLEKVLRDHRDITEDSYRNPYMAGHPACECGWEQNDASGVGPYWSDHAQHVWQEVCTITTAKDLDRVPARAIVRSNAGTIACRFDGRNGVVFGDDRPFPWHNLALPAAVIWHPEWSES